MTETTDRQYISALAEPNLAHCSLLKCSLASAVARTGTNATSEHFRRENVPPRFVEPYRTFVEACRQLKIPGSYVRLFLDKPAAWTGADLLDEITNAEKTAARRIAKMVRRIK